MFLLSAFSALVAATALAAPLPIAVSHSFGLAKRSDAHLHQMRSRAHSLDRRASTYGNSGSKFVYYSDQWENNGVPPDPSDLPGWNVYNLGFYMTTGPTDMAAAWANDLSDSQRSDTLSKYKAAGMSLMVSAFGSTDAPTTNGADPTQTAQDIANWVKQFGLDGVDVDYEDFTALSAGTAEQWLITFTQALRQNLPAGALLSHAPISPWFTDSGIYPGGGYLEVFKGAGSDIDWFNLQYYNQGSAYTTCQSILNRSDLSGYEHTSIFELHAAGIPLDMLILGKPGDKPGDESNGGHMPESTLAHCVAQGKAKGWSGGLMVWEYPDVPEDYVSEVWGQ